ncbi:polypeptide N-acetylgalactosaminyltransferase 18-like isoform X3 [Periophthalmus magnuspinnatus]|uniref:polypeptide N-acetylgalactosaminyltransferase 18-like isoform X3 n=1 Tax=Periophthalmus magnuspinnatus TaxID=409849 RepID=UPI0024370645|nr:polypeptide N-acetylgalactosaminyltransferase 18-like isoform X3 [Periophthalmus magnuspinnatus]
MLCTRRTKTLVSTCVILSGMTNIVCLLYVGWVTNYVANNSGASKVSENRGDTDSRKLEEDSKGETLKIIERLERLESVVNEHIREVPAAREDASAQAFSASSLFAHWGRDLGPESRRVALKKFRYYGYNSYLSDRISLTRPIPDLRPDGCRNMSYSSDLPQISIIFIFVNEALSVLLRSVHTAIQRTPRHLLKEIVLVDDHSNSVELKEHLQSFVDETNSQHGPDFVKVVRHDKQEGLIRSRVSGWRAATAPVVALFDAHVEFNIGWAEPILQRIKEDRTRVVSPSFDNIKYDTFEIEEYPLSAQGFDWELWCRYLNPPKSWWTQRNQTAPIRSPALIGCFVVDRKYFGEIGLLDEGMEIYGGENVELGIRNSGIDIGDISERKTLRSRLQCRPFSWFLSNIYPELRSYSDTVAYGVLKNSLRDDLCLDQGPDSENVPIMYLCHGMTPQNVYYTSSQQLHLGVLSPTIDDDDNKCLVDVNNRPRLLECRYAANKHMKLTWAFSQGGPIQNTDSLNCLELVESRQSEFRVQLSIQACTNQKWTITNILTVLPQ